LCSKSRKEKKKNINNDLAVLPSHDKDYTSATTKMIGLNSYLWQNLLTTIEATQVLANHHFSLI